MRAKTIFAGFLGALALVLPAAAQRDRSPEEMAAAKALSEKMAADPTLSAQANADFLANNLKQPGMQRTRSGIQYKILRNGFGRHPGPGDMVEVYYTARLVNGKMVDGTSTGLPASFPVSVGSLIPGWVEVLQLMRVGDRWQVTIPGILAYGVKGSPDGGIPPNQVMVFDLQLLNDKPPPRKGDPDYRPQAGEQDDQK